jgi:hypothetical protein
MPNSSHAAGLDRDIALRRQWVGRDLEELQARLSPGQLLDEAVTYLRRSQGSEFFRNLGESIRNRPLTYLTMLSRVRWLALGRREVLWYAKLGRLRQNTMTACSERDRRSSAWPGKPRRQLSFP